MCGIFFQSSITPCTPPESILKRCENPQCFVEFDETEISQLSNTPLPHHSSLLSTVFPAILFRGPNAATFARIPIPNGYFHLISSVLSLRQPFTRQPLINGKWIFQFNGELYDDNFSGNDSEYAFQKLQKAGKGKSLASALSELHGEFAFVLSNTENGDVFFGKDSIGKRSLLFQHNQENRHLMVSSVVPDRTVVGLTECKGSCLYAFDGSSGELTMENWRLHLPNMEISSSEILPKLRSLLQQACSVRQSTIEPVGHADNANLAVLFSGGLDCTVLSCLIGQNVVASTRECFGKTDKSDNCVGKTIVDLLTVGFENPRTNMTPEQSPDRILSKRSWFELCHIFPPDCGVQFRLVLVDVPFEEFQKARSHVLDLMHPCSTEMDLSIAIAFHFASKKGQFDALEMTKTGVSWEEFQKNEHQYTRRIPQYASHCKVLFSGLGADELFGGYSRHENIFHCVEEDSADYVIKEKYGELHESLQHDIDVIYERNLGRDDRAISCWGKELRYPYLDEQFVRFSMEEIGCKDKVTMKWEDHVSKKKGPQRRKIITRKAILRDMARDIGISMAADESKRAIQFGAKSAKIEIGQGKSRGTDKIE